MPGREELIQQNIARGRTASRSPQVSQSPAGTSPSVPSHRSLMGGNLDVASALSSIQFLPGTEGDYSMRNSVAFIRKWKRGNSAQVSDSLSNAFSFPSEDSWKGISSNIANLYSGNVSFPSAYSIPNLPKLDKVPKFNPGVFSGSVPSIVDTQAIAKNISFAKGAINQTPGYNSPTNFIGEAKSANPWGYFNRFFGNFLSGAAGRVNYSGKIGESSQARYGGGTIGKVGGGGALPEGIWQFLFNPSELELSAGPEFKNSEVWGVSDKSNSGQPLHWSNNKNAELKFSSILLNGYIFGKQVEELEQGILELFMSRDGDGDDGPPVLEFVWGDRIFGPCLIKDISVKEKMWDAGRVVNAELSFTLVQVPEWTINDGFVDVARPGRAAPISSPSGSSSPSPSPSSDPPGGGGNPDQKGKDPNTPPPKSGPSEQFCKQASNAYTNFNTLGSNSGQSITDNIFNANSDRVRGLATQYQNLVLANNSVLKSMSGIDPKCSNGCAGIRTVNSLLACVRSCSYQVASKIQGNYTNGSCKR